ncbi:DUF6531 domain-containing protein [Rhodanobacter denitrificans]|uniref:RHS repeat-associated core domain-containing protein n=1 Tax=Rhodanobacter denitrificans TaxID=666685 RepID=UPI001F3474B6|nr:RHS repeat-associated core domain-containing protein [Rhodanobacter denitrificans]UJM90541.1 DUF6531 domain-containing protein [Rhodanobacter denitrificans]
MPRFFLFLALALGLLASPHQAKAVMVAHPVICTTGTPGYQQSYVCDVTWIDDGDGGGGGNGSVGVGGGGGGSPHTSVNTQSTVNQNNSKNPKLPCDKTTTTSVVTASDPIDTSSGSKIEKVTDFAEPGEMGLTFERYYNSRFSCAGSNAPCTTNVGTWTTNLDYELDVICYYQSTGGNPDRPIRCGPVTFTRPDGSSLNFVSTTAFFGTTNGAPNPGPFSPVGTATLTNNGNSTYTLRDEDAQVLTFDSQGNLLSIKDPSGIGWTLTHPDGNTTVVTHTNGTSFKVALVAGSGGTYGSAKQINVTDPAGGVYVYQSTVGVWDSFTNPVSHLGVVSSETLPGSPSTTVAYKYLPDNSATGSYAQLAEVDYNGVAHDVTTYDGAGRANLSSMADGTQKTTIVYGGNGIGPTATVTNPLGHIAVYQYNGSQLLLSVTGTGNAALHCDASFAQNTYDANGNLATSADNNGNTTQYVYAATGLLQKKTEAAGTASQRITDFTWDTTAGMDRPLSIKIEGLSETDFAYDSNNRLAAQTLKNLTTVGTQPALTTTYAYTYYANGMLKTRSVTHPSLNGSNTDVYTYDTLGNLATVADGLGHTTTYSSYSLLGRPGQISGPNGDVTNYTYDARGRVASIVRHPNGVAATWTYTYDGFGLPAGVTAPDNSVSGITRNAYMQVTSVTHNDKDGTSTESFSYDANGDVVTRIVARGGDIGVEATASYDGLGRMYQKHGMHGQTLTYAYDKNDNVVSVTDALGHAITYQYDALNRVTQSTDPNAGVTKYTYDLAGHVITVTDPRGLVTTYAYDGLGQLWSQSSPDTGTTTFAYDAYGRRYSMTRADGVQTIYGYDTLNRPTSVSAGGLTQSTAYDSCTHGIGRPCSVSDANSTTSYTYTPEGWITGRGFSIGGTSYALGYGYDSVGHVASVVYPDGNSAAYSYINGAVSGVTVTVGGTSASAVSAVTYRPGGTAMASWTSSNGLTNTLVYDSDGRLGSINVPGVQNLAFTYDAADRITQITNGLDGSMTETIGYDAMSHLTTETSGADNESYTYDAAGNRTHQVVNGNTTTYSMAATSNRLATLSGTWNTTWGYDAEGAITTANGTTVYQYDPFHRLVNANGTSYVIGPEGQRLRKMSASGVTTYFAPDRSGTLLAENQSGTWMDYVWLNGRLVTAIVNGGKYPVHADQTGRPMAVTNSNSQAIVWQAQGLPFTNQVTTNVWRTFNLGFPGQYHDLESGMWQNGARDYNPYIGRYVESDPIGLAGGINTYAYVGNNPLSNIDPFGLQDTSKEQKENAVQGATNLAGAAVLPDSAGAVSDIGGALGQGAVAISSGIQTLAQQDYNAFTAPEGGTHIYPKLFGDMNWSQYPTFAEAWKAYLMKRLGKCP